MTPTNRSPLTTYQGTNPHTAQGTSLGALGKSLWRNRRLITLVAAAIAWAGYAWFRKTRKGFADVL